MSDSETLIWGLLGPETLSSERRTRTLGVGASVRLFNELAVPGIGGVWFGKQIFLATLGVAVAESARSTGVKVQNIETANAIEAFACWHALKTNGWKPETRLRGATKMQGKEDFSFATVRKHGFYVTQPMRMATVQALPSLGLVDVNGSRFNGFSLAQYGHDFIEAQCPGYGPDLSSCRGLFNSFIQWVSGISVTVAFNRKLPTVRKVLSPLEPMEQSASDILMERLIQGSIHENQVDKRRRRAALSWVEFLRGNQVNLVDWDAKPDHLDAAHWHDLRSGGIFFSTRDAAIRVLDQLEAHIGNSGSSQSYELKGVVPEAIRKEIKKLRKSARDFLGQNHTNSLANEFCKECVEKDDIKILAALVKRDEQVLRLRGEIVLPGPAFSGHPVEEVVLEKTEAKDEVKSGADIHWPEGISYRVRNLFLLNADLHSDLARWLGMSISSTSEEGI